MILRFHGDFVVAPGKLQCCQWPRDLRPELSYQRGALSSAQGMRKLRLPLAGKGILSSLMHLLVLYSS